MLTVTPAFLLRPEKGPDGKARDVRVPNGTKWEAAYEGIEWSAVHRECPLEAAADCMSNAVFWDGVKRKQEATK